ncbi:MAG: branched-chain amino acid ABC transporter permease [Oligoflexia bacterium]|nr:branched-chain amino acid ABC transporter permease [Oligoflexia bacterium]
MSFLQALLTNEYYIHLVILICIYALLAQSFNLTFGLGKSFNLAHIASYAIGAYTTAILAVDQSRSPLPCMFWSLVLSGVFALTIAIIAIRLSEDYFAIGTLAFSALITALLVNWKSLTRGVLGIPGIPRPEFSFFESQTFYDNFNFLGLAATVLIVVELLLLGIFSSPYARALRAQAEFEQGALAIGHNARVLRTISFVLASAIAGLAGSLFAYYINYIDPSSFSLTEMVFIITIVVLGRPGSFWGVNGAAAFLVLLPEPLRQFDLPPSILGPMRQLIYALILFGVVFLNRNKLWPRLRRI